MGTPLRRTELLALALVVSFCSIVYEFLIARTLVMLTGQIVLWQSLTIGIYVAALGFGTWLAERSPPEQRLRTLYRVELALSLAGALSVALIFVAHVLYRLWFYDFMAKTEAAAGGFGHTLADPLVGFALVCQLVTIGIGVLSGFEIPLLIALHNEPRGAPVPDSAQGLADDGTHRVLGWSYIGTLVGSLAFGLWLMPHLDVLRTAFVVAAINLAAAAWLALRGFVGPRLRSLAPAVPILALLAGGLALERPLTQLVLKNFYYNFPTPVGLAELPAFLDSKPDVHRIKTPYQDIDVVWDAHMRSRPDLGLVDLTLFLGGHYQFSALDERSYHEWIVHVPTLATGTIPRRALILGAGDGLLARELLRYGDRVERIVQVELDPVMIELATTDPWMLRLNERALLDPRVEVVVDDAFTWLRTTPGEFDAIFVDFPYPYDYELSRLYSVELFRFLRAHLAPDGHAVFDYPLLSADHGPDAARRNTIIMSTVHAAGFHMHRAFGDDAETFVLLGHTERSLTPTMRDLGFPLQTLDGDSLRDLTRRVFPYEIDPTRVNSVFHPRMSELNDLRF